MSLLVVDIWLKRKMKYQHHLEQDFIEDMLMIYSTDVRKTLKIFFSKGSAIIKKTSTLPLKLIQLNSLKQSLIVLMVFTRQWCIGRQQNC